MSSTLAPSQKSSLLACLVVDHNSEVIWQYAGSEPSLRSHLWTSLLLEILVQHYPDGISRQGLQPGLKLEERRELQIQKSDCVCRDRLSAEQ